MSSDFPTTPATWSYAVATVAFVAYAIRIGLRWRGDIRSGALLVTLIASAAWAAACWQAVVSQSDSAWWTSNVLDVLRIGSWLTFLAILMEVRPDAEKVTRFPAQMLRMATIPAILSTVVLVFPPIPPWQSLDVSGLNLTLVALLGLSVCGLVFTEQLYRRTPATRRWAVKPLTIGLAGMFSLDVLLYSGGILFHQVDSAEWAARGVAQAAVVLMVAVATHRTTTWAAELHVSRELAYQSTAVLFAGLYLLVVAGGGYWVHYFGGDWGGTLRAAFVFAGALCLFTVLLSGSVRARFRVFVSKNLFSYRYDYRREWLNFTHALGSSAPGEALYQQVIRAMADLVESHGGALWLKAGGEFVEVAHVNCARAGSNEPESGQLATFLAKSGWVIRVDEYMEAPARYEGLALPAWLRGSDSAWLLVPLKNAGVLIGFVILSRPRAPLEVNWEVRDLLKTAGRQAAISIAQIRATEALVESEKFDSFNRLSAFVVHDLKNLVAQLGLSLKNAARHQDNPEFRRDMLETVGHAVDRMNQLMLQLRSGATPVEKAHAIDLSVVVQRVVDAKKSQYIPVHTTLTQENRILAHSERIERVIGHIVQNAIDASESSGDAVTVATSNDGAFVTVEIADTGVGMSDEFVEKRLFHPFQTTKPQGMGIGMYESFHYVHSIGGRMEVRSAPGVGTSFRIHFPVATGEAFVRDSELPTT